MLAVILIIRWKIHRRIFMSFRSKDVILLWDGGRLSLWALVTVKSLQVIFSLRIMM